jgi:hypothetical protein
MGFPVMGHSDYPTRPRGRTPPSASLEKSWSFMMKILEYAPRISRIMARTFMTRPAFPTVAHCQIALAGGLSMSVVV